MIQLSSLVSAATTVIFNPTDDTMIKNEYPYQQAGYSWNMAVRNAYGETGKNFYEIDSLINFDVFSIPSTATILSASIHLYYYNWSGTNPAGRTLNIYFITSDWTEEYVNWNTQPSYRITPTGSSTVPTSEGHWMTWDVTNDVQYLIQERASYGWKIADENDYKQPNIPMTNFRTKEYEKYTPFLEVTYIVPEITDGLISSFSIVPLNPTIEDTIQFTDTSYDPDDSITTWFWNFGDGDTSMDKNPTHTYTHSGQYTVTLQVTNTKGATDMMTASLSVSEKKSTPGFELFILISAIAFILFLRRKEKQRN